MCYLLCDPTNKMPNSLTSQKQVLTWPTPKVLTYLYTTWTPFHCLSSNMLEVMLRLIFSLTTAKTKFVSLHVLPSFRRDVIYIYI